MHPDNLRLAAYIDGALGDDERAALRAHVLTCPDCAARLERLRADARQIAALLSAGAAPDVRAAVWARRRRRVAGAWLARGGVLAAALATLLIFAVLIGVPGSGTIGRTPDRLFVADRQDGQLVALDAGDGTRLAAVPVGADPARVLYDRRRDRLYVLTGYGVAIVDPRALVVVGRWDAPHSLSVNADIALDERRGRLYVSQPAAGTIAQLDTATLTLARTLPAGANPGALALAPDGRTLFMLDGGTTLWAIETTGEGGAQVLDRRDIGVWGTLALSPDGASIYVLRQANQPLLQRIDVPSGRASDPAPMADGPQAWDMVLLDAGHLAIARGDGRRGGVEIVATDSLSVTARIDPSYDQHHLAAGPGGSVFALNWLHDTVTRYDTETLAVTWQTPQAEWQPWDGVFVPGGWRWPW